MVRPLRSTPITGASSLLRTGPPARPASVLNTSQFLLLGALPLTTPDTAGGGIGACLPIGRHRLGDPVRNSGHTEHPGTRAMRLRYLHRLHRGREVTTGRHPIPNAVKISPQISLEVLHRHLVHTRCTLVGPHLPIRLPELPLGDLERLPC